MLENIAQALQTYYQGWLSGGMFWWLYPVSGIEALHEPWHTPAGFWLFHGYLVLLSVVAIICLALKLAERVMRANE